MRLFRRKPRHKHIWGKEECHYDTLQVFYRCECGAAKWTDMRNEDGIYSYPMPNNRQAHWYDEQSRPL